MYITSLFATTTKDPCQKINGKNTGEKKKTVYFTIHHLNKAQAPMDYLIQARHLVLHVDLNI